jgi:hypothetical protein
MGKMGVMRVIHESSLPDASVSCKTNDEAVFRLASKTSATSYKAADFRQPIVFSCDLFGVLLNAHRAMET